MRLALFLAIALARARPFVSFAERLHAATTRRLLSRCNAAIMRIGAAARACLSAACIRVRPANGKRMAGERRTRNNQRVDRTDEWDTTVEDTVRSIDGTGACNVN